MQNGAGSQKANQLPERRCAEYIEVDHNKAGPPTIPAPVRPLGDVPIPGDDGNQTSVIEYYAQN